jgi:hypothetical protein
VDLIYIVRYDAMERTCFNKVHSISDVKRPDFFRSVFCISHSHFCNFFEKYVLANIHPQKNSTHKRPCLVPLHKFSYLV